MAYVEISERRMRRSKTYHDAGARLYQWSGALASLHYPSSLDSSIYDNAIDMTAGRVNNATLDGWRVTANGFHYTLGRPAGKVDDGWVGFGGRQGVAFFWSRLLRVGYLHHLSRQWYDIGGAPTYTRVSNLIQTTHTLTIGPNNDALNVEMVTQWDNLWNTPGGGGISVRWRVNGDALKEEIVINEAARNWIAANRAPGFFGIPANEAYFGFVFQTDFTAIPRVYRNGMLQDVIMGDFADDGQAIELRTNVNDLLAFLPLDYLYAGAGTREDPHETKPLRKRFWTDVDGNTYLALGILASELAGMKTGPITFDPTVNEQVGATSDDAWYSSAIGYQEGSPLRNGGKDALGNVITAGVRFTTVNVPQGATITTAKPDWMENYGGSYGDLVDVNIYGEASDNAATFSSGSRPDQRTKTTAFAAYDSVSESQAAGNWKSASVSNKPPEIATVIQEIINRAGWVADNSLALIVADDGTDVDWWWEFRDYAASAANAAKLDITYTTAAGNPWYVYAQQ